MKSSMVKFLLIIVIVIGTIPLYSLTAFGALATPTLNVSASSGTCNLSWNGISGATGYDIYRNGNWYRWVSTTSTADTGLSNGSTYTYTVAAQNANVSPIDTSPQSASKTCTPSSGGGGGSLSAPSLNVSASSATCSLSWNSVSGATGYDVFRNGTWYRWVNGLSTIDSGLSNGTTYTYTVSAQNANTSPIITSPQSASKNCTPNGTTNPSGFVVSQAQFNQMFPNRNSFYTYSGLIAALSSFPAFTNTGSDTIKKREAAAFLGNVAQETGHLQHIVELNTANYPFYCASHAQYPCAPGKQYYGRGPIQLSWNYNYGAAGAALGLPLLSNPDLVAQDASVAWKTALWFWVTQTGAGTMTSHNAIVNGVGFGETIRTINGSIECNGGSPQSVNNRVSYFTNFANILGVSTGGNLTC